MSQQLISANELNSTSKPTFTGLYTTGSVGVNTSSPAVALDVVGTTRTTIANGSTFIARSGNSSAYTTYTLGRTSDEIYISIAGVANNFITGSVAGDFTLNNNTGNLLFGHGSSPALYINGSNYVGISQISPGSLLHIGNVQQQKYVITSSSNHIEFFKDATPSYAAAIGLDTPAAGSLNSALLFSTYNGSSWSESMRIDSSGRLGLNVIPSNWYQFYSAFQIGSGSVNSYSTSNNYQVELTSNAYGSGAGSYSYINTSTAGAGRYQVANGFHIWYTAGAGTAGSTASFNESMRINTSGYLGIGTSSPSATLTVSGSIVSNQTASFASALDLSVVSATYYVSRFYNGSTAIGNIATNAGGTGIQLSSANTLNLVSSGGNLLLDTSGNLGLGVTPSGWAASGPSGQVIQAPSYALSNDANTHYQTNNAYYKTATGWVYIASKYATQYQQNSASGAHSWYTAASGTAGNTISFTQSMTLDNNGNLMLGTTTQQARLHVSQNGAAARFTRTNNTDQYIEINGGDGAGVSTINANYTMALSTGGTERARIDTSGNFGIGTTSPSSALYVKRTSGNSGIYTDYNGTNVGRLEAASNGNLYMGLTTGSGSIGLGVTSNANAVLLDSSGNFLIGTTSALSNPTTGITFLPASGASNAGIGHVSGTASGSGYWYFAYNGSNIGSITQSGTTAVLYNTTSDQRLKENIVDAESASSLIDAIQVRQFDWKSDGSHQRYGFIAQELVTVAPEAVHQPEDPEEMMAVDYSKLVPMLIKAIQELKSELDIVKTELAALKS